MSRSIALSTLALFVSPGAVGSAHAEDWRVCVANMGNSEPGQQKIIWTVSQPFEVSQIPDWQEQMEAAKAERRTYAAQRNLEAPDDSFACTPSSPDLAGALDQRENMKENFRVRLEGFQMLGVPFTWEEWSWTPTGSGSQQAEEDATRVAAEDDGEEDAQAAADRQREADAAAAETRRQQQLAADKAERDSLAAEKAKIEKEIADAKRERDRLAAEKTKEQQASTDTDANRCVTSPELRQNDTFQGNTAAYVTNGCGTPVDVRICLMKENQVWNCGMTYGLAPQGSWSWSSMKATGQVFMDARVAGSTRKMSSP
jgi:hypothetical protein